MIKVVVICIKHLQDMKRFTPRTRSALVKPHVSRACATPQRWPCASIPSIPRALTASRGTCKQEMLFFRYLLNKKLKLDIT